MLKLEVINYKGITPPRMIAAEFDKVGGGIGRGDVNALILPDADHHISRLHARISYRSGCYFIEDHGTATPVIVNGRALGKGIDSALEHGDEVTIGDYRLRVHVQEMALSSPVTSGVPESRRVDARFDMDQAAASDPLAETRALPAATTAPSPASVADPFAVTQRLVRESVGQDDALRAFLDGAGIADVDWRAALTPQTANLLGQLWRETLQALLDLLLARALLKRDLRTDAGMKPAEAQNPLKFVPTVDAALAALLNPQRGDMQPLDAVKDACNDLRAHQFAFMAGMQAALEGILKRFDPQLLAQEPQAKSALDAVLPNSRKAKLWDQFSESYRDLSSAAEADFQGLFGREFMRCYEEQFNQLLARGKNQR